MSAKKKKTKAKAKKTTKKKPARKTSKIRAKVSPIPEGYRTITTSLILNGAGATIDFCKAAFGAKVRSSIEGPNGLIMHAVLKIGDSLLHIGEAMQTFTTRSSVILYVKNADRTMEAAVAAGAEIVMPLENTFWGDRYGVVKDPQGNQWEIATHIENVSSAELKKRSKAIMVEIARSGSRGG
ncbi:MAG TPA: VOC family protein [Oligoflexus sp.]|uniref:VOC family protein n=1 Tax=Oligoflexus sp. TaxID=1971216 RepID=UPI002D7F7619|nr:VOC family protein [Oligoflexus sp.]HET9239943.1 VOC family protein [Oligoflexus sp.]